MNEPAGEFSVSAVRAKRAQYTPATARDDQAFVPRDKTSTTITDTTGPKTNLKKPAKVPFDPWRVVAALKENRRLVGYAAGLTALAAFVFGFLSSNYHVRVTLLARESANALALSSDTEAYRPRQLTPQTLVNLMQSPELRRRVAAASQPPVGESSLEGRMQVASVPGTDLVGLTISGKSTKSLVALANLFGNEAVEVGRQLQVAESVQMNRFCSDKLVALDKQLLQLNAELVKFQKTEKLADPDAEKQGYVKQLGDVMARSDNARIEVELVELQITTLQNEITQQNPVAQKLEAARSKLTEMYGRYTEAHPLVQSQRKMIAELEKQLTTASAGTVNSARYSDNPQVVAMYSRLVELQTRKMTLQREMSELTKLRDSLQSKVTGLSEKGLQYATIKAQLDGLQKTRAQLAARQREAQLYQESAQGYYRVYAPVTLADVDSSSRWFNAVLAGIAGLVIGMLGAGLVVAGKELADRRLKTVDDVLRETGLPVLASLGDLKQMSPTDQEAWAFRTWTAISGQLNASPNRGLVCGFISSAAGEGRSTWIELLVGAAKQRGLQVMTVSTRSGDVGSLKTELPANVVTQDFSRPSARTSSRKRFDSPDQTEMPFSQSQAVQVAPRPVTEAHIPLPGKVWDLAHRKEWQNSLAQLRRMDNLVLLVELPPASLPEAVLLAESLPQLIWLTDSGKASVRETRQQLQTLRHAKCRLVGAVLNHEPKPIFEL